jgi:ABC-type antimicrobial peptide transport system permease subunit
MFGPYNIPVVIQYQCRRLNTFYSFVGDIFKIFHSGNVTVKHSLQSFGVGVGFQVGIFQRLGHIAEAGLFKTIKKAGYHTASLISGRNEHQFIHQFGVADGNLILKKFKEKGVFVAEPQFFKMFNFPLAAGNIANAISGPNTALLTKDIATKFFGDWKTAMGKTFTSFGLPFKVTGILNNPPANTDFPLGIVFSYSTIAKKEDMENWGGIDDENYCFVQLPAGISKQQFDKLLTGFVDKHIKPVNPNYDLVLQPLNEMHYDERFGNFNFRTFSKDLILALSLIGLFLLIIACVNFINLTTAQAINRSREVGVRKVLGGNRSQLVLQFLGETGTTVFIALVGAVIIAFICLRPLNNLLDIHLAAHDLYSSKIMLILLAALLGVTFLSGFYPALVLSGFKPVHVFKNTLTTKNKGGVYFRRGLVVFQFVIAQVLIIGTLVVASQMDYFRTANMGFNKEAIVTAGIPGDSLSRTKYNLLRNELLKLPDIENISFSTFAPTGDGGWATDLRTLSNHSNSANMIVSMKPADTSYFRLYNLQLAAGRIYFPSDTVREFVVNEAVVNQLHIPHPADAIGKLVNVNGKIAPIVGVVKDFHVYSLRDPIGPVVLTTISGAYGLVNVKLNLKKAKTTIAAMEALWNKNFPDFIFEYNFLDETIAKFYTQEDQLAQLYKIFSVIAIFISCLGLYGLISFMAVQRKKEIGIRKVLGAPVSDIVVMLSKEFTILIAIAFLVASPIAWYFMHQWLQQYTYRIMIGAWFFAATIISSLVIAWLTVGYTAIKAALANPVNSLRTE